MSFFTKLKIYKYALQILFAMNVVLIAIGILSATSLLVNRHNTRAQLRHASDRIQAINQAETLLLQIAMASKKETALISDSTSKLRLQLRDLQSGSPRVDFQKLSPIESSEADAIMGYLSAQKDGALEDIEEIEFKLGRIFRNLAVTGLAGLFLGIIFPWIFIRRISNKLHSQRLVFEQQLAQWVQTWYSTYRDYGAEAYKKASFWLNIILLTVEAFASRSRHPGFQLLAEFAPILRREIKKEEK